MRRTDLAPDGALVSVTTPGGTTVPDDEYLGDSPTSPGPNSFWYLPPPNIESIDPAFGSTSGVRGDENVVLTGTNLDNINEITLSPNPGSTQGAVSEGLDYFLIVNTSSNGTEEADVEFAPTQSTAGTDYVSVTSSGGVSNPLGSYFYTVGDLHLGGQDEAQFTYFAPPAVTSVSPTAGPLNSQGILFGGTGGHDHGHGPGPGVRRQRVVRRRPGDDRLGLRADGEFTRLATGGRHPGGRPRARSTCV